MQRVRGDRKYGRDYTDLPGWGEADFPKGITGKELAETISKSLAKKAVAMSVNGRLADLADPIEAGAEVKIVTRNDPEALESSATMPRTFWRSRAGVVPGHPGDHRAGDENGFYYDFSATSRFIRTIFQDRRADARDHQAQQAVREGGLEPREGQSLLPREGEEFKVELVDAIPENEEVKIYRQGEWLDLCRGPHMTSTGQIGNAFKLQKIAGSYWRDSSKAQLQRIYGTAWANEEDLKPTSSSSRRPRSGSSPARARDGPLPFPGGGRALCSGTRRLDAFKTLENYMRRRQGGRLSRGEHAQILDKSLWRPRPLGDLPRAHVHHHGG